MRAEMKGSVFNVRYGSKADILFDVGPH